MIPSEARLGDQNQCFVINSFPFIPWPHSERSREAPDSGAQRLRPLGSPGMWRPSSVRILPTSMSGAQLHVLEHILKELSPLLGGLILAWGKRTEFSGEWPECLTNCVRFRVLSWFATGVSQRVGISPRVISGWIPKLQIQYFEWYDYWNNERSHLERNEGKYMYRDTAQLSFMPLSCVCLHAISRAYRKASCS